MKYVLYVVCNWLLHHIYNCLCIYSKVYILIQKYIIFNMILLIIFQSTLLTMKIEN